MNAKTSQVRVIATEMSISMISLPEPTSALILLKFALSMLIKALLKKQLLDMKAITLSQTKETLPLDGQIQAPRSQMTTSALQPSISLMRRTTSL
jgi:hypothetical protein